MKTESVLPFRDVWKAICLAQTCTVYNQTPIRSSLYEIAVSPQGDLLSLCQGTHTVVKPPAAPQNMLQMISIVSNSEHAATAVTAWGFSNKAVFAWKMSTCQKQATYWNTTTNWNRNGITKRRFLHSSMAHKQSHDKKTLLRSEQSASQCSFLSKLRR